MAVAGQPIEAVLTLNATNFHSGIADAKASVEGFVGQITKSTGQVAGFNTALNGLVTTLNNATLDFTKFTEQAKGIESFNKFANGVKALATAIQTLGTNSETTATGVARVKEIIASIEGVFKNVEIEVKNVVTSFQQMNGTAQTTGYNVKSAFEQAKAELMGMQTGLYRTGAVMSEVEGRTIYQTQQMKNEFKSARSDLMALANGGAEAFNKILTGVNKVNTTLNSSVNSINMYRVALQGIGTTTNSVVTNLSKLPTYMSYLNATQNSNIATTNSQTVSMEKLNVTASQSSMQFSKLSAEELKETSAKQRETNTTNQNSSAHQRNASAMSQASARTNQLTSATSRLSKVMSSLRMMGTMVGSMLAYNFAHNLLTATNETIHAKSEMNGYFQMLGFGKRQVMDFNNALDETIKKFPRLNKYSLGETISSIGVEFELSTAEMKKAMPVVSMITSEYLRAGRNVNEASLAVKDILQGEFQRLSRETGVKGDQLKEAGWSGDKTDVMGLLEALDKVGKSRNWDTFVAKANSLNDAILILQNRFGEWSADMVERVQPTIVSVFNMIMGTAQKFANTINGALDWLSGDGIENQIGKWTVLGTAITSALGLLVAYRTGAGLLQIAQIGLTRTIASTVLGLNAEQVALYGTRTAIAGKILGLEAEKVATMSTKDAILTKILGLNAEVVAQSTLKQGILDKAFAQELETLRLKGATQEELLNTLALYENQLAQKSSIGLLSAQALGLNMTTYATHGFTVALIEAKTGMDATKIASMGLGKQLGLLAVSFGLPLAIVGAFTGALILQAIQISKTTEAYKKFTDMIANGDQIISDAKSTMDDLSNRETYLKDKLSQLTEGTAEYNEVANKLKTTQDDLTVATQNYSDAVNSVAWVKHKQELYDESKSSAQLSAQKKINQALIDYGFNVQDANQISSEFWNDAITGWTQHYQTLQKVNLQYSKNATAVQSALDELENTQLSDKEVTVLIRRKVASGNNIADAKEELGNATSLTEYVDKWLWLQVRQLENSIVDFDINQASGGLSKSIGGLVWGLLHFFGDNFIGQFTQGLARSWGLKGIGKGLGDAIKPTIEYIISFEWLQDIFSGSLAESTLGGHTALGDLSWLIDNTLGKGGDMYNQWADGFSKWANEGIESAKQGLIDTIDNFLSFDWLPDLGGDGDGTGGGMIAKKIDIPNIIRNVLGFVDSIDVSWIPEWFNNNIITPLSTFLTNFASDPMGTLDIDFSSFNVLGTLSKLIFGNGDGSEDNNDISWINSLFPPIDPAQIMTWVQDNLVTPLSTFIQTGIMSIPLVGDILALFGLVNGDNSGASQKGNDLATSFKNKLEEVIRNIPILGDILQLLGIIPQANPTASSNGQSVGDAIKTGFKNGLTGMAQIIQDEISHILNTISGAIDQAGQMAQDLGNAIVSGVRNAIDPGSPGIIARSIIGDEFGTYIPQVISDNSYMAYSSAQQYGQSVVDGISSVNFNSFGALATDYESDAQTMISTTQLLGLDTTMAFTDMALAVNNTTNTMGTNVIGTYNSMSTQQSSMLQNMKTQNMTAYNDMYQKSNQSLIQMRDSTSNITAQMVSAWSHMKNQIVATANQLKSESTSHFNQLSSTIGDFYRKIQNPANWGANGRSPNAIPSRTSRSSSGRSIAHAITSRSGGKFAGGRDVYNRSLGSSTMTIAQLKRKICPSGNCDIFDGYSSTTRVNPSEFLGMFADDYVFGWNDWSSTHYSYIKDKSDQWEMKSPQIQLMGGIDTDAKYKVGDFENGSPQISFESFQSMAESIFSVVPYRLYYNSDWKGSWLGALQAGACNCYDGASALIALANTCGFSGSMGSGSWGSYGHVWAIINGKIMDTTAWQGGYGWTSPKVSGYGAPNISARRPIHNLSENNQSESVKVEVTINGNIYGIDDLDSHISESIDKGLEKHFNKAYTIGV